MPMRVLESPAISLRQIHDTAIIHPNVRLGRNVEIGPYSIIGDGVAIGDGTVIGPHVIIEGLTVIGENCRIYTGSCLGSEPQDTKFNGEETLLVIGNNNLIREYVTIARGTMHGRGETKIGNNNMIMSYAHVGHDCIIGNGVVITNSCALGGHVVIEDCVVIGGLTGIHQFVKVGTMAMLGGMSKLVKDVPPYVMTMGAPAEVIGINVVGLRRNGVTREIINHIREAYKLLYRSGLNVSQAVDSMERNLMPCKEIKHLLDFLRDSTRGITRGRIEA